MATLATTHPTLLDLARRTDPDGSISAIVELLNQNNEILDDMVFKEGNLLTGERTTIRTGIPAPTWRKINGGVQPNKGTTAQVTFDTGMMEAYAEVDKALADLNGNTAEFRLSEDVSHIEGMNIEMADTLFHGNVATAPEEFTGFNAFYNDSTASNGENIIKAGGASTDNTSIWLVVWGPQTVYGIVPKGSTAGIQRRDMGEVTIENIDGAGGRMQAYRTHYRWDVGLAIRDWRYVVRIANIDKSDLTYNAASGADIVQLMVRAMELIPNLNAGRPVFYMSRSLRTYLRTQTVADAKYTITQDQVGGRYVLSFDGIPVRRVDQLAADEATVS